MKTLNNYTEKQVTKLMQEYGAFFCFGSKQFNEQRKEGVKYIDLGAGLVAPKEDYKTFLEKLDNIHKEGIKQDLEENGKNNIILRELYNHEAFYTWDTESTIEALEGYGFADKDIIDVFNKERK